MKSVTKRSWVGALTGLILGVVSELVKTWLGEGQGFWWSCFSVAVLVLVGAGCSYMAYLIQPWKQSENSEEATSSASGQRH